MSMPGPFEWVLIFIVALMLFGPKKLPEIGRALGEGIREFKRAMNLAMHDEEDKNKTTPPPPAA